MRKGLLVLRSPKSLNGGSAVGVTSADRQKNLANVDTSDSAVGLTPGTTHTSLETIGSGARQHLVDTDDVEGVGTNGMLVLGEPKLQQTPPATYRTLMWKPSLPAIFTRYLLAQMRAASRACICGTPSASTNSPPFGPPSPPVPPL